MSGERGFLMLVEWDDLREKGIFFTISNDSSEQKKPHDEVK